MPVPLGVAPITFHWDRPDRKPFIASTRTEGAWDRAYLHSTAGVMLVLDDQLVFPYMGTSGTAPSGKKGMYTGGSIGLATLRRDGFASMDAGEKSGTLTTRPIRFKGGNLFVNFEAPQGELRVEVLTLEGKTYGPYSAENCIPLRGGSTKQRVTWKGAADVARASNKNVQLRFTLTNGSLYSFWITDDAYGASHGYLGAGGPGFAGVRDDGGHGQP